MRNYHNLSIEYFYIGNIQKTKLYHDRVFRGRAELADSTAKNASGALNRYKRNYKDVKYNFDQSGIKGIEAKDKGKRANFGESGVKYAPEKESATKFKTDECS